MQMCDLLHVLVISMKDEARPGIITGLLAGVVSPDEVTGRERESASCEAVGVAKA